MWLFDRHPTGYQLAGNPFRTPDLSDWRSPENVTWALMRDDQLLAEFPILSAVLARRHQKRTGEGAGAYLRRKDGMLAHCLALKADAESQGKKAPGGMFHQR